jgi:CHAD domain-containing protein
MDDLPLLSDTRAVPMTGPGPTSVPAPVLASGATGHALVQLLARQIAAARQGVETPDRAEATLIVRRRLKKARSTLRLILPTVGPRGQRLKRALAEVSHTLGDQRDRDVAGTAARVLAGAAGGSPAGDALRAFAERRDAASTSDQGGVLSLPETLERDLRVLEAEAAALPGQADPVALIETALIACYRRGRADYRRAIEGRASDAQFHDWRKRVKTRLHWAKLLPAGAKAGRPKELERMKLLARTLGEDHDLEVLDLALAEDALVSGEVALAMRALIARQRRALRRRALELGTRLYRRSPKRFADRLRAG